MPDLPDMNEALEAAKQALQSVNDELRSRNEEVTQVNADLSNFALTVDLAMLTLDMEQRIRRFTPKALRLFQLRASDVGRALGDIKHELELSDLGAQISEVLETGNVREREVKDRAGRWYRMQIGPYLLKERIAGAIVSLVDIDHLKQLVDQAQAARAEAERANLAKDEFLAMLSHELRTPLSSMLLNAQRLRSTDIDRAGLDHTAEMLERATRLQTKLIDDLLDVSRIASGKLALEFEPVDLSAVIRDAVAGLRPLCESKGLTVQLSLDPGVGMIWADVGRVQQIAANLIGNAIKFTPRGGQISIVVDASGRTARLRVTDTGIGIEPAFLPQLFLRFSQRDTSITRKYGGLGLGLALVRQLVELHGGSVQAQSAGPGQGASFMVTLPFARASDKSALQLPAAGVPHALDRPGKMRRYDGLLGLRVLFVDDDLSTREAVLEVLELAGAKVELAASASEAVAAIEHFLPQVIVCDLAMPGEDGYAFMRKLRAREGARGSETPALALSALASKEDRRKALAAGFQQHLAKPIDIDRLRSAVLELSRASNVQPPPSA